ncbi:tripartite tricarboxylate transporter substrate-binding protein [Nonomuraea fuscirosea]|jgi:putative tricarboxylic transport membrane protein|uniref:Bug family tripartite tricarboxylate transporter substrate binding protein n=1 Tax=Nonomuraea fuscirosea TaxID=1291556 RepID=UPI002DDAFDCA|nr:tripartite tricarboxylate transporter substrate-binding protein [Nonomuraea fuscirosea]WSA54855.1 tripartite tricarboxylate transporter substrate-binding protein [Nonomuraea fuscirosea]
MGDSGSTFMRRRGFIAWGLGLAACAAGCGVERAGERLAAPRTGFSINSDRRRWARVGQAFAGAARAAGFEAGTGLGAGSMITVTGLPALTAAELNNGQSLLDTGTPLARLSGEAEVVVVPDGSPLRDFDDFSARLLAGPGRTLLTGGPQGEPDHLLFGLIAKALGADTRKVDYTGYPSSGEAVAALLAGRATAAAGPLSNWRTGIGRGRVRALAVSSARRVPDLDAPTLLECGVRVDFADWVAAFGPDDMPAERREAAVRMCDEVLGSRAWEAACRTAGWLAIPLAGDDFALWLGTEIARTRATLRDLGLIDATKATTCWGSCGNGH